MRLLGVGVTGLTDYTQEDLFAQAAADAQATGAGDGANPVAEKEPEPRPEREPESDPEAATERHWPAGHDVRHAEYGAGWVQGSGVGRVTVRFEEPTSVVPGRVRTFRTDDPDLELSEPLPLVAVPPDPAAPPA